jgi:acyl carrier protein
MSLDLVELVVRTEEVFSIDLPNSECEQVQTVGDLYRLVLIKLNLAYLPADEIESQLQAGRFIKDRSRLGMQSGHLWTSGEVWVTLKATIKDQLQVDPDEVRESASFQYDLGCD